MRSAKLAALAVSAGLAWQAMAGEKPMRIHCVYHAAHGFRAIGRDYQERTGVSLQLPLHVGAALAGVVEILDQNMLRVGGADQGKLADRVVNSAAEVTDRARCRVGRGRVRSRLLAAYVRAFVSCR